MDLTKEKWLPVIFSNGDKKKISLRDLLDNHIQDLAYPRADFQGAAWQMLIGILQCTVAPEDKEEWADIWHESIEFEQWEKALNTISLALQFGEQKPSFLVCNRYMVVSYCHMKRSEPVLLPKVKPCFAAYGPSLHLSRQQQS